MDPITITKTAYIAAAVVGIVFVVYAIAASLSKAGKDSDERTRLIILRAIGEKKYPGSDDKSMWEFMRRDTYHKLKLASNNNEQIDALTTDYNIIVEELKRLGKEEEYYGGEFTPHYERRDSLV